MRILKWIRSLWKGHDREAIARWKQDQDRTDYLIQVATRAFETGRPQLSEVDVDGNLTIKEVGTRCPRCDGTKFELRNYEEFWRTGNLFCRECGSFVSRYKEGE